MCASCGYGALPPVRKISRQLSFGTIKVWFFHISLTIRTIAFEHYCVHFIPKCLGVLLQGNIIYIIRLGPVWPPDFRPVTAPCLGGMGHCPYSLDLPPSDFHLFGPLKKKHLAGKNLRQMPMWSKLLPSSCRQMTRVLLCAGILSIGAAMGYIEMTVVSRKRSVVHRPLPMFRRCVKVKVLGIRMFITIDFGTPLQMVPFSSEKL